jgi:steroid delta-isomerase-like uncharacterized protein
VTRDQIQALIARCLSAWQRRDVRALVDCYHQDCEIISPMFRTVRGRSEVEASLQDMFLAFTDFKIDVDDLIVDVADGRVALITTTHATHHGEIFGLPPSGRRIKLHVVYAFHVQGDQIRFERRLYDYTGMLIQMGVLKAEGG